MALTRHATGHSAPRKPSLTTALFGSSSKPRSKKPPAATTSTPTKTTKTAGGTTANTSKPRAKTVASGRVGKSGTAGKGQAGLKRRPRKTSVKDKVQGLLEKAVGTVEGKPGKKGAGTKKIRGTDGKGVSRSE
ncbi:hypothetical protein MMC07_002219 [Pseudocyphellaria aurata]|nr:hypothetical protein [Pseudocyphellaria aurata]